MGMRLLCESPDDPECMYHSDCANCMVPPLSGWEYNGYKGIVFDEAKPEMVLREKRLF